MSRESTRNGFGAPRALPSVADQRASEGRVQFADHGPRGGARSSLIYRCIPEGASNGACLMPSNIHNLMRLAIWRQRPGMRWLLGAALVAVLYSVTYLLLDRVGTF